MPIADEMQRIRKQEEAPKASGIILGALDRAVQKFDATVDKGRDAVTNALDKAANKVEQVSAAAFGTDTAAVVAEQSGGSSAQAVPSPQTTKGQGAPAAAEDDESVSSSAYSPTTGVHKTHRRPHLHVKSPGEIKADMKRNMEKVKQKLQTFAENVRGPAATLVEAPRAPAPSDAFLGPDQSPKTLEAKRLKRQKASAGDAATTSPRAALAAGSESPAHHLFGTIGSAVKEVVKSPLVAAGHAARTVNDLLPEGTIPEAVTNLLPPASPTEGGERPREHFAKLRRFAKRMKLGIYLIKNPQVLKTIAIAGAVLVVGILMGSGALIMHLVDRRMLRD